VLIRLFLLFVLVPTADLVLLWILFVTLPWYVTLLTILITALLGTYFSRQQGARVLHEIRQELQRNLLPANSLVDGVLVFTAGVLLITPGVLTDLAGFALLLPPVRRYLRNAAIEYLKHKVKVETVTFTSQFKPFNGGFGPHGPHYADDNTVDGEVVDRPARPQHRVPEPRRDEHR
jgi:UPF0716 protein FxsA